MIKEIETEQKAAEFNGLIPGVEYQILISITTCGQLQTIEIQVRTVAAVVEVTVRITNVLFTPELKDKNSQQYKDFVQEFIDNLTKGLSDAIQALFRAGKLSISITSIEEGSVVVNFSVAVSTNVTVPVSDVKESVSDSLKNSSQFVIDAQNTTISDRDSCQPGLNDCSVNGTCIRQNATYTCQCNDGFTDTSPSVPGRKCEDIDECQTGNNTCSDLAVCTNTPGSFSCRCFQGIVDNNPANPGTQCPDPNSCFIKQTNICDLSKCSTMDVSECNTKKAFRIKATLRSRKFNNQLRNPSSVAYRNLSAEIRSAVVKTVQNKLMDDNFNITIIGFQNGSVIANLLAFLDINSNVSTGTLLSVFGDALKAVDNQSFANVTGITQAPTPPVREDSGFRVSTIVLGVLLGLALLILLAMVVAKIHAAKNSGTYSLNSIDTPAQNP
ncbi:transmembrane matrix receptor MUP-4-like [Scyliorhinus canicula]|uniref:transmembrane matrix receptor MUP-4-like n=1 Tax=Scyliorhinus canicula TaxID=7830 RepID=UPI0018F7AC04|nr:transmembrane matrix receptor MUP-4-like [Scyliorhinus canicula]